MKFSFDIYSDFKPIFIWSVWKFIGKCSYCKKRVYFNELYVAQLFRKEKMEQFCSHDCAVLKKRNKYIKFLLNGKK